MFDSPRGFFSPGSCPTSGTRPPARKSARSGSNRGESTFKTPMSSSVTAPESQFELAFHALIQVGATASGALRNPVAPFW